MAAAAAAAPSSNPAPAQDPPVVVVGAGMAGLAAAVALHKVGRAVHKKRVFMQNVSSMQNV